MHICHLINSLSTGGGERVVTNLVTADQENTYTVCALEDEDALLVEVREAGAEVHLGSERFRFDPRNLARVRRWINSGGIDVLHTHLPYAQVVGRLLVLGTDVRAVVSTQHSHQDLYHPVLRALERFTAAQDDATVAVSSGVKTSFSGSSQKRNWCTIHNGIDAASFHRRVESYSPRELTPQGPVFLNVGRCIPPKAQAVLVEAMAEVKDEVSGAKLIIAGDGPLFGTLRSQVVDRGLSDSVYLVGHASPIEPYYAMADVFVSPSRMEGLPVTLLEAMAAKLPIVASDIPGVSEVVVDGMTGRLVPPDDPRQLASAMVRTAYERTGWMEEAAFQRVRDRFSVERMLGAYLELYHSLLD